MKKNIIIIIAAALAFASCVSMDMTPKSQGNSNSWYTTETELNMAVNEFYVLGYWDYLIAQEQWSDNFTYRNTNRNAILEGTVNGQTWDAYTIWQQAYKLIARANSLLDKIDRAREAGMDEAQVRRYEGEAYFSRACKYGDLVFFFGDVPYIDTYQTIQEAEKNGRTPKAEVIAKMYADFDHAAEYLPADWGVNAVHFTKGAAYAMKARYALYNGDWAVAAEAAQNCIKLGNYALEADYADIFWQSTGFIKEKIFAIPRSIENSVVLDQWYVNNSLPRNAGGYAAYTPSWDLLAAYLCTDGKPIDESPLFNSLKPFENRDPRCTKTIVEFNTMHCGFEFDPSPATKKVTNASTGAQQDNQDSRIVNQYASYNGLLLKKGVDATWTENGKQVQCDYTIMRYADVLLMYAEAKIELNQIDDSVLDAINQVRARAYQVSPSAKTLYPAVTATDQATLRQTVRLERRVELAFEGLRYRDLIRWRLAEKALNKFNYINLAPQDCLDKVVNKSLWFWGMVPEIDEDGMADFAPLKAAGLCEEGAKRIFPARQYLLPIPTHDIELSGGNLTNNEGY